MLWRLRESLDAADLVISAWEARADRAIGRARRKTCQRYLSILIIGAPIAYVGAGLKMDAIAWSGLAVGIGLYAAIDVIRRAVSAANGEGSGPFSKR